MKYSNIPAAKNLVVTLKQWGIKDIIISPGSRNAPLILSFSVDSYFNCYSIVDERSAAFFALGLAQNQQKPCAVVCTSGSALLNYYPAVAEAYYSEIPLLVISADRPPYKIDVGDGQTIRQDYVFDRHIGYSANLKLDVSHATTTIAQFDSGLLEASQDSVEEFNNQETITALQIAWQKKLPVHINIPFEEPLYGTQEYTAAIEDSTKYTDFETSIAVSSDMPEFQKKWRTAKKKMVLVGVNHQTELSEYIIEELANDPTVVVFTETTSNLHHPNFFPSIDSIIFPIEKSEDSDELFKKLQPTILLTFGGLIVSKKLRPF